MTRDIRNISSKCERLLGRKEELEKFKLSEEKQLQEIGNDIEIYESANALIGEISKHTQEKLKFHISNLVTSSLETVFGDGNQFELDIVSRRNGLEADFLVRDVNGNLTDPISSRGGGIVDMVSFSLRVALWGLKSDIAPILVFDEPFKNLSEDLQYKAGQFIETLSNELGIQFIVVSHERPLIESCSNIYKCKNMNGISKMERTDNG